MEKKVAIVGAGVGGLLACKYILSKGYHPIIFEALDKIGGVWASNNVLESTKLQSPKPLYQFSDFSWPSTIKPLFPTSSQALDYINSYAKYFDLLKYIRFNTKVININYEGVALEEMQSWTHWSGNGDPFGKEGKWLVLVQDLIHHSTTKVIEVDFVILCVGRFSGVPKLPIYPAGKGPEAYEAMVIHSMEYSALNYKVAKSLVKGKQVTVVGFGKTAMDIAMECAMVNGLDYPCRMIYRNVHWKIPDSFLWTFPLAYLFFNRFAEIRVRKCQDSLFITLLSFMLWPLVTMMNSTSSLPLCNFKSHFSVEPFK